MKKVILFVFAILMVIAGVQAQNKPRANKIKQSAESDMPTTMSAANTNNVIILEKPQVGMDVPLHVAFDNRRTVRNFSPERLDPPLISSLLWSAYGINRREADLRVVPSAMNVQEFDIYLFNEEGAYLYDAHKNTLTLVAEGDLRQKISPQPHFAKAPVSIVIVANYDRMTKFKKEADRDFYAAVDCGYVSQNIYLFCASANLGTVACGGINREEIAQILKIKNGSALLAHPVGFVK